MLKAQKEHAMVFGGGGSKGVYAIFLMIAIRKLVKNAFNDHPKILVGSSIGAVLAGGLAALQYQGKTFDQSLALMAKQFGKNPILFSIINFFRGRGLLSSKMVKKTITELIDNPKELTIGKLKEQGIIVKLTATDIERKETLYFGDNMLLSDAMRISGAFPGAFKSEYVEAKYLLSEDGKQLTGKKRHLSDGGIYENMPINAAIENGAKRIDIFYMDPQEKYKPVKPKFMDVLFSVLLSYTDKIMRDDVKKAKELNNVLIEANRLVKPRDQKEFIRYYEWIETVKRNKAYSLKEKKVIDFNEFAPSEDLGFLLDFTKRLRKKREAIANKDAEIYADQLKLKYGYMEKGL